MTRRSWVKVGFVYGTSLVPVGSLGGVRDGLTPPARPTSGQETRQIFAPRVPQILEGIRVSALTWAWLAVRCIRHSNGLQQACAFAKRCWRCAAGYFLVLIVAPDGSSKIARDEAPDQCM